MVALSTLVAGPAREIHKSVALEPDGRVFLRNSRGRIQVTAWERNEVQIEARIEPRNILGSQRACLVQTDVRVDAWPRSVRITPEYAFVERRVPRLLAALFGECTEQPLVHYRIKVPRMAELVIVSGESRVSVEGLAGRVEVRPESKVEAADALRLDPARPIDHKDGCTASAGERFERHPAARQ